MLGVLEEDMSEALSLEVLEGCNLRTCTCTVAS